MNLIVDHNNDINMNNNYLFDDVLIIVVCLYYVEIMSVGTRICNVEGRNLRRNTKLHLP